MLYFAKKIQIVSTRTEFQRVDVLEVLRPSFQSLELYHRSLLNDGSYESQHPELFEPDRIVYLDGVLQSRRSGDAPYHEILTHPSLFAHKNPKRVAIIGGGEGATLREVLKHKTVQQVYMIEIDEMMVSLSREYLPGWSDCSNIVGSTPSCFDDPRVELRHIDAFQWFIDNFSGENDGNGSVPPFDVIIMDALDPQIQKDFVDALYDGGPFLQSLPRALADDGILTAQVGHGDFLSTPAEEYSDNRNRVKFIRTLVKGGFQSVLKYDDRFHSGFVDAPWQIMVALKDRESRADWFANSALVELKIRQRLLPAKDGSTPLYYFDGPRMQTAHYPSKPTEAVFCRGNPDVRDCQVGHGFDPERRNLPLSSLEVKPSTIEKAGRGVFAAVDIPQQSYVGLESLLPIIYGSPQTYDLMARWWERIPWVYQRWWGEELEVYTHGYGHVFDYSGGHEVFVDSTFHCFINHACKGQNNVGWNLTVNEANGDPDNVAKEVYDTYFGEDLIYNPAAERQVHFYSSAIPLRDIKKGEELFDN